MSTGRSAPKDHRPRFEADHHTCTMPDRLLASDARPVNCAGRRGDTVSQCRPGEVHLALAPKNLHRSSLMPVAVSLQREQATRTRSTTATRPIECATLAWKPQRAQSTPWLLLGQTGLVCDGSDCTSAADPQWHNGSVLSWVVLPQANTITDCGKRQPRHAADVQPVRDPYLRHERMQESNRWHIVLANAHFLRPCRIIPTGVR